MRSELSSLWSNAGGSVPEHWNFVRFEELLLNPKSMSVGVMYPGKHDGAGVPLIRVADVKNGAVVNKPDFCIGETVHHEYRRTCLDGNELLITLVGNPGDCVIVEKYMADWNVARALAVVRLKDPDIRAWLRYVLLSNTAKHIIGARLNTTVQKTLNLKDIRSLPIPIAPLSERKSIVDAATALEDKINLNHQVNQTLEQMAQAIFKSWFVDFEPTRAKIAALEAGGSEDDALLAAMQAIAGSALFATDAADADAPTQLARLQTEHPEQYTTLRATAELFPSAMQESELGEIPEGWNAGQLSDIAMFTSNRISVEELSVETYISTENMLENKAGIRNAASLPSAATVIKFEPLHILVSNIRPYFKKIWLANFNGGRSADVLGFESKHQGTSEFLYNLLYQDQFFDYMMLTSKGAKMPRGDKDAIMQFAIAVPPVELMKYFSQRVEAFYNLINMNRSGGRSLSELRDTLLPKLLSGELSVSAATDQITQAEEAIDV